jgi:hypothetical protein
LHLHSCMFPTCKGKRYNSNGYASGILRYLTGSMLPRPPHTPGFNKPVPASEFWWKDRMKGCVFFVAVLGLIALMSCSSSLPRRSEQSIRQRILRDTPIGSSYVVVLDFAKKKDWPIIEQSAGYEIQEFGKAQGKIVGKRVIRAYLGGYQGLPWRKDVDCYWAFDEHDKLIEVFVDKQADAP